MNNHGVLAIDLWEVNHHMRAYAVVVDCLTDSAQRFYAKYGFEILPEHNGRIRLSYAVMLLCCYAVMLLCCYAVMLH